MSGWAGPLIALGALALAAPAAAWLGMRHGRKVRRTAGLALILLGFGQVFDPPQRNLIEAAEDDEEESEAAGEPKDATSGG